MYAKQMRVLPKYGNLTSKTKHRNVGFYQICFCQLFPFCLQTFMKIPLSFSLRKFNTNFLNNIYETRKQHSQYSVTSLKPLYVEMWKSSHALLPPRGTFFYACGKNVSTTRSTSFSSFRKRKINLASERYFRCQTSLTGKMGHLTLTKAQACLMLFHSLRSLITLQ